MVDKRRAMRLLAAQISTGFPSCLFARYRRRNKQGAAMFRKYDISEGWPCGISDGLVSPCAICGSHTYFDFLVTDEAWHQVVPKDIRSSVVCLSCFDLLLKKTGLCLLKKTGLCISDCLLEVQLTLQSETIILKPDIAFIYKNKWTKREDQTPQ